ncbi:hypothetical protein L596_021340 [Steinernema carpocapsae]|uniref:SLC12A transporter C-terminal domain-containing protein n=1 Tax=Steinernema carpocapsae TaxID=34508 RepID=A0A4U5MID8_STECR|nr:hypothetical protein L596_021340 [Steinernema carpocapsae]
MNCLLIVSSLITAAQCARAQRSITREMLKCRLFDGTWIFRKLHQMKNKKLKHLPMSEEQVKTYTRIRNAFLTVLEVLLVIGVSMQADADALVLVTGILFMFAAAMINITAGGLRSMRVNSWHPSFRGFYTPIAILASVLCLITAGASAPIGTPVLIVLLPAITVLIFIRGDSVLSTEGRKASQRPIPAQNRDFRPHMEQNSGTPTLCMTLIRETPYSAAGKRTKLGQIELACSKSGMTVNDLPGHAMFLYYQKISSLHSVILAALNNSGMGMFQLDTVIMNYPTNSIIEARAIRFNYHFMLQRAIRRRANVITVKGSFLMRRLEIIDVWWILDSGDLLVHLAVQLSRFKKLTESTTSKIRLFIVVPDSMSIDYSVEHKLMKWCISTRTLFYSVQIVKMQVKLICMYVRKLKEQIDFRVSQVASAKKTSEKYRKRKLKKNYPLQSIIDLSIQESVAPATLSAAPQPKEVSIQFLSRF